MSRTWRPSAAGAGTAGTRFPVSMLTVARGEGPPTEPVTEWPHRSASLMAGDHASSMPRCGDDGVVRGPDAGVRHQEGSGGGPARGAPGPPASEEEAWAISDRAGMGPGDGGRGHPEGPEGAAGADRGPPGGLLPGDAAVLRARGVPGAVAGPLPGLPPDYGPRPAVRRGLARGRGGPRRGGHPPPPRRPPHGPAG